jgi:hypothetical protein
MAADVRTEIDIGRPRDEVAAFADRSQVEFGAESLEER